MTITNKTKRIVFKDTINLTTYYHIKHTVKENH